ncbi:hypothetical protein EVAR_98530_1 [Eumeta japonica]|uniref:Uncharacterized protein n=1 Tax=Eumeta variegata TaxID=151549 RepID=A0A4C2A1L5_EUMVA|nr:hypothetical protein EVAR_98530_1 [Eumeta japonica]
MAKPLPMGVPPFKPPSERRTLKRRAPSRHQEDHTPLQIPQAKGPGLAYQSENNYPRVSHEQVSKMVSQMTATHTMQKPYKQTVLRITPEPIIIENYTPRLMTNQFPVLQAIPTTINPFVPMPASSPPAQAALTIIPAPILKNSVQLPLAPSMLSKHPPPTLSLKTPYQSTERPHPTHLTSFPNFVDPVPKHVNDLANRLYPAYNTKKIDDYNSITGYGDDTVLNVNKQEINER